MTKSTDALFAVVFIAFERPYHFEQVARAAKLALGSRATNLIVVQQGNNLAISDFIGRELPGASVIKVLPDSSNSKKRNINHNVFLGLRKAFEEKQCAYAIVLEDDIVVSSVFFEFVSRAMNAFSDESDFRAINGFSRIPLVPENQTKSSLEFVRCNFGVGWGWAINRKNFIDIAKCWNGAEDEHWDSLLEPYFRTGYVIFPRHSLVKNIGLDGSGAHTGLDPILSASLEGSFHQTTEEVTDLIEAKVMFPWRSDCFSVSVMPKIKENLLYLIWSCAWKVQKVSMSYDGPGALDKSLKAISDNANNFCRRLSLRIYGQFASGDALTRVMNDVTE